ncbi:MAG: ABC transporter ATP-binding protein [Planctomycetota bacterium]
MTDPAPSVADDSAAVPPAIDVRGLKKRYGRKVVLDGIDLQLTPGTVFGYIGPNGAGKSTTVKILTGLLGSFEGEAIVCGHDVRRDPIEVKRCIGYVPENAPLYEQLTVEEFLLFVGRLHHQDVDVLMQRIGDILEAFELGARRSARLGTLSKGMRQKAVITSSLLHDPDIIFLDEPLTGLDVNATVLVKELIRALADRGKTVFYCSHIMDVVERVCDRVVIIDGGHIVADGTVDALLEENRDGSLEAVFRQITRGDGDNDPTVVAARIAGALDVGETR